MPRIFLKKKITTPLAAGFPWIFEGDMGEVEGSVTSGEIIPVFTHNGSFVGKGFYSETSKIKVRILSRSRNEEIDLAWWRRQLKKCRQYRERFHLTENCRLVYGESDGLPGLIVDRLGGYLIVQSLTAGMDAQLEILGPLLQEVFTPQGIFLKNDAASRTAEGLEKYTGFLSPPFESTFSFQTSGITAGADLAQGPPTNFFLDNRQVINTVLPLLQDARVLVPFCRTGIFEAQACLHGAASVQAIMADEKWLPQALLNTQKNGVAEKVFISAGNAFDFLKQGAQAAQKYDLIFLDPPNFAKGKATLPQARNAWRELNLRAMQLLKPGGFLATTTRSHLMAMQEFTELLQSCARSAGKAMRIAAEGGLPPDFPRLPYLPQGDYLKFILAEIS